MNWRLHRQKQRIYQPGYFSLRQERDAAARRVGHLSFTSIPFPQFVSELWNCDKFRSYLSSRRCLCPVLPFRKAQLSKEWDQPSKDSLKPQLAAEAVVQWLQRFVVQGLTIMAYCLLIPSYLLLRSQKILPQIRRKKENISVFMEVIFTLEAGPNVVSLLSEKRCRNQ